MKQNTQTTVNTVWQVGSQFTSELNDIFYYIIENEDEDFFYYRAVHKITGRKSDTLDKEYKSHAQISFRDGTYNLYGGQNTQTTTNTDSKGLTQKEAEREFYALLDNKLPKSIEAFEIEQGINKPEAWPLCLEIANRYNNYQKLLDSNRELLEALKELHGYTVSRVKSYNIKDSTYFRTINMMANGLHNKFNAKEDTNS